MTNNVENKALEKESISDLTHTHPAEILQTEKIPSWMAPYLTSKIEYESPEKLKTQTYAGFVEGYYPEEVNSAELDKLHTNFSLERLHVVSGLINSGNLEEFNPRTAFDITAKIIRGRDLLESIIASYDDIDHDNLETFAHNLDGVLYKPDIYESLKFGRYRNANFGGIYSTYFNFTRSGGHILGYPHNLIGESMGQIYRSVSNMVENKEDITEEGKNIYSNGIRLLIASIHPLPDCNSRTASMYSYYIRHSLSSQPQTFQEDPIVTRVKTKWWEDLNPDYANAIKERIELSNKFKAEFTRMFLKNLSDASESGKIVLKKYLFDRYAKPDENVEDAKERIDSLISQVGFNPEEKVNTDIDRVIGILMSRNSDVLIETTSKFINILEKFSKTERSKRYTFLKDLSQEECSVLLIVSNITNQEKNMIEYSDKNQFPEQGEETNGENIITEMRVKSLREHPRKSSEVIVPE